MGISVFDFSFHGTPLEMCTTVFKLFRSRPKLVLCGVPCGLGVRINCRHIVSNTICRDMGLGVDWKF